MQKKNKEKKALTFLHLNFKQRQKNSQKHIKMIMFKGKKNRVGQIFKDI